MRKQQQYRDKNRFRRGSWNVNCVMMSGGLGGEAMSSEDEGKCNRNFSFSLGNLYIFYR